MYRVIEIVQDLHVKDPQSNAERKEQHHMIRLWLAALSRTDGYYAEKSDQEN